MAYIFLLLSFMLYPFAVNADGSDNITRSHGFALYGELKYGQTFSHLQHVNPNAPKGGKVTLMATGTFDTLNPYTMKGISPFNSPGTFVYGIGELNETLLAGTSSQNTLGDEPYSAYGLIAETLEYPDNRQWVIFSLRPEARFHDGENITADDVVFSYNILKDKGHPRYAVMLQQIDQVEKLSPLKVKVTFKEANAGAAILRFGELPILPEHYWQDKAFEKTTLTPPLLSGPYKIGKVNPGQSIVLDRVNDYWGKELPINRGRFNFDQVTIEFYRDLTIAFEAFKGGEFDIYKEYMSKNWAKGYDFPALNEGKVIKKEIPHQIPSGTQAFFFNTRNHLFKDARVRKALSSVFDFSWTNANLFHNAYKRSASYFPNSAFAATGPFSAEERELLKTLKIDLPDEVLNQQYPLPQHQSDYQVTRATYKEAFALLKQAGWFIKAGKLTNEQGQKFTFEFLIRQKGIERILQPFSKNLEKLGIESTIRMVDASQYKVRLDNFDFDVTTFVLGQNNAPSHEQQDYFHSSRASTSGSLNLAGISHPAVDALTEHLLTVKNKNELIITMRAIDRILLSQHYVVPNWYIDYHRIAYQNRFGIPDVQPNYHLGFENWWFKE